MQQNIRVAVDAIVFGYSNQELQVLLIKRKFGQFKDEWALPGGFVKDNEPLKAAVERELKEETGIEVNYLEQLYTFGEDVERDPRGRVIAVAYFALVNPAGLKLEASTDAVDAKWFQMQKVPSLAFDHNHIVSVALDRLAAKVTYQPLGFDLLAAEFPFSDVEQLYRTVLGRNIDRRNFRKKILDLGVIEETGNYDKKGSGRPGKLYRFNYEKYRQLEEDGFHIKI